MISEVALKCLKPGASKEERVKLLQEAVIMAQFKHSNVLQSYGVVAQPDLVISRVYGNIYLHEECFIMDTKPEHESAPQIGNASCIGMSHHQLSGSSLASQPGLQL